MEAAAITWRPPPVRFTLCRTRASIWSPSRFSLTSPPSSFKPLPISTIRATANSDQVDVDGYNHIITTRKHCSSIAMEQLGGAFGEPGSLVLPCVANTH